MIGNGKKKSGTNTAMNGNEVKVQVIANGYVVKVIDGWYTFETISEVSQFIGARLVTARKEYENKTGVYCNENAST